MERPNQALQKTLEKTHHRVLNNLDESKQSLADRYSSAKKLLEEVPLPFACSTELRHTQYGTILTLHCRFIGTARSLTNECLMRLPALGSFSKELARDIPWGVDKPVPKWYWKGDFEGVTIEIYPALPSKDCEPEVSDYKMQGWVCRRKEA